MATLPWTQKYVPLDAEHIKGQEKPLRQIISFLDSFPGKKRALLLHGPPGCGKSSVVIALAKQRGYELIELNASDKRNKGMIEELVGNAIKQGSLFGNKKLILIDEVDGVSGRKDRGGVAALNKLLKNTPVPIIMTANDGASKKLKPIKRSATAIEFQKLDYLIIADVLKTILQKENIMFDEEALKQLARQADGDLRAAINDCEFLSRHGGSLNRKTIDTLMIREKQETIANALIKVFKNKNIDIAKGAFDRVQETLDTCFLWVEGNLPKEYNGRDLARAYAWLSLSNIFRGRIYKHQYWRFLVYQNIFMTAGVAAAKQEKNSVTVHYEDNKRILSMWILKQKFAKRAAICAKLAPYLHQSQKKLVQDFSYYKRILLGMNEDVLINNFDLDQDEITWLRDNA